MKIKLIDVKTNIYETQFGTCELCFWVGDAVEPTFYFEKETGEKFEVDGYYWSWGDLEAIYVDNVINLADYISRQYYDADTIFDYNWLNEQVDKFGAEEVEC